MPKFTDSDQLTWGFTPGELTRTRADIAELQQIHAARAALDAREAQVLARMTRTALGQLKRMPNASDYAFPIRSMATEAALALRESPRAMQGRMDAAFDLVERFPATTVALSEGRITARHVREIVGAGTRIQDDTARAAYEADVVSVAESMTPFQTKQRAVVIAERHDPEPITERFERARGNGGVWVVELEDAMAELRILMPAVRAYAIRDRLTAMGKVVKRDRRATQRILADASTATAGPTPTTAQPTPEPTPEQVAADERHLGQLRADLAADLLLSGQPTGHDIDHGITATIEVTIPVTTLTGLDDGPALLAGYGPIDPDTARRLAGNSPGWERLFLHPDTGALLTVDHYVPTAAQKRFLHARDKTCRVPGCTTKAKHSDIDHTIPYSQSGTTNADNLACLCEGHHMMKHHTPWHFRNHGHGRFTITSPCGHTYDERPPTQYAGIAADTPAPF